MHAAIELTVMMIVDVSSLPYYLLSGSEMWLARTAR